MLNQNDHVSLPDSGMLYKTQPTVDPVLHAQLKGRVIHEQRRGKSLEGFSRGLGVPLPLLVQWLDGPDAMPSYAGYGAKSGVSKITDGLINYFAEIDRCGVNFKRREPDPVVTSVTSAIVDGVKGAALMCIPRLIDAPPGVGKTMGINQYVSQALKADGHKGPTLKIRLNGAVMTQKSILSLIAKQALGGDFFDERNELSVKESIEKAMEGRGGVLLVDEAQHLGDAGSRNAIHIVDLLRDFTDSGCFGVVMFSSGEVYSHLKKGGRRTQILSRMDAFRIEIKGLYKGRAGLVSLQEEDVFLVMRAWNAEGPGIDEWCLRVAQMPGALRNVTTGFLRAMEETGGISLGALKRYTNF